MTNVIAFRIEGRRTPSGQAGGGLPAAILFFTGIRYVRDRDDEPVGVAAAEPDPAVEHGPGPVHDAAERLQA